MLVNGEVVGGLTGYVLDSYYRQQPQVYIYDVAVSAPFQRQGIGRRLMAALTEYCTDEGFAEAFGQAEAADAEAVAFYRATGGKSETKAVQFSFDFTASQQLWLP